MDPICQTKAGWRKGGRLLGIEVINERVVVFVNRKEVAFVMRQHELSDAARVQGVGGC